MEAILNLIRGLVRPVVTVTFVVAYIVSCFMAPDAAELMTPFVSTVVTFWFIERMRKKELTNDNDRS